MPSECWSYSAGVKPYTVTVYEREPGGVIYARAWDPNARNGKGNWRRVSLKHRSKTKAQRYATAEAAKLQNGDTDLAAKTTLAEVFTLYERHRTPTKAESEQKADKRRIELWSRVLGPKSDPHNVSLAKWEAFISARSSGAIDAKGQVTDERKPVRAATVAGDCIFLTLVFNWAVKWRLDSGRYLMRENPARGYDIPREKNPRRPVATQDRFEAVRAVADHVEMEIRWNGKRERRRSYLPELLDIVNGTGRRIRAVCELRYDDLRLERTPTAPYGSIRWPADTDKTGRETLVPISPAVRAAVDRVLADRPGIGRVPLFPSPKSPEKPITRHLADSWLRLAEKLAKLESQPGSLWHAYRRKWATERKHLPDVDVAAAGGWASLEALKKSYQQADAETMLHVVLSGGELRETQHAQ